jgi:hypothetical protein
MFKLFREFLSVLILKMRQELVRQACYDAVAYSVEQQLKSSCDEDVRMELALKYLSKVLPGIDRNEAIMYLESLQSKLVGVGANPSQKV